MEPLARVLGGMTPAGARIRLVRHGYALVVLDSREVARLSAELPVCRVLGVYDHAPALHQLRESALTSEQRARLAPQTLFMDPSDDLRVVVLGVAAPSPTGAASRGERTEIEEIAALERAGVDPHPLPDALPARAFLPLPAAERAHPYRTRRLHDPEVRSRARALAGEVDAARLEQTVRDLATGPGETRFSGRPEVNTFARQYLLDSLRALFTSPGDTVIDDPFDAEVDHVEVVLHNVIARRPGVRPGSGKYVLGAHYDSIARRTPNWDPATQPAPGADDNASGVACVLEAARVLLQDQYDFDLEFCFFSGEEQFLLGSKAYVADSLLARVDEVLGAIVLDMVAFNPRAADSLNVLTNFTSEWLADLVREGEAALSTADGLDEFDKVVRSTLGYSDHASYWAHDASAVLFIENTDIVAHNPNYHRVTDDLDYVLAVDGADLMRRSTEVVVATLGQFAIGPPPGALELTIPSAGLLFRDEEGDPVNAAVTGETITTRTRVVNEGPAEGGMTVHTTVFLNGLAAAQADTSFPDWGGGVTREVLAPLTIGSGVTGNANVGTQVVLQAGPGRTSTLSISTPLSVTALGLRESPYIAPNPATSLDAAQLWLRLTGPADVTCRVIDALGGEQGRFTGRVDPGDRIPVSQMVGGNDLPSGIYLLQLEVRPLTGGPAIETETMTFALTR